MKENDKRHNTTSRLSLSSLEPSKRYNAFYIKSELSNINRFSIPIKYNSGYYIYEWDETLQRHIRKWVEIG